MSSVVSLGSADAVHGETTRKTGDGTEKRLEGLGQVVRDEVLVDLHHGGERRFGVGQGSFTADSDKASVVQEGCNETSG